MPEPEGDRWCRGKKQEGKMAIHSYPTVAGEPSSGTPTTNAGAGWLAEGEDRTGGRAAASPGARVSQCCRTGPQGS